MPKLTRLALLVLFLAPPGAHLLRADEPARESAAEPTVTPEQEAFFEKKVRPLLTARCFECHSEKKQEGGLRLDSRGALLTGNDAGPAVVAGKPEESRLVEVIGYQDTIRMPPRQKLSDDEIATLTEWVKIGAPFPGGAGASGPVLGEAATPEGIAKARATHWAFQPIRRAQPPPLNDSSWGQSAIDRFILAKLQQNNLTPSPRA